MKHTKEPWRVTTTTIANGDLPCIADEHDLLVAEMQDDGHTLDECESNADRIVDCVNACAGINPSAIPDVVAALRLLTEEHIERGYSDLPLGAAYQSHAINRAVAALVALEDQP